MEIDLKLFLDGIKNTEIIDDSEEGINDYAKEGLKLINNQKDVEILKSEIDISPVNEENLLLFRILMKISENINFKFKNIIVGCLYNKIIKQFKYNRFDYLYLLVSTYISLEPKVRSVQNIMKLTDSWGMYYYLLKYCLKQDNQSLDKKYVLKSFEIFRNNYKDYDYTPILPKELAKFIIKNESYSKTFADFILDNNDLFVTLLSKRKFKLEDLKQFVLRYPDYFGGVLLNIIKTIFGTRNHQLSYELADNIFLDCIICVIKNEKIKSEMEILISDSDNRIFDISVYIFSGFVELGFFNFIKNNNLYDHMIIEIFYLLKDRKNKKKFYELNKEIINKNKKLNKENKTRNKKYLYDKDEEIRKTIDSLIAFIIEGKGKNNGIILTPKIFKLFLDNQNIFNDQQVEYVIEQVYNFLDSEKTNLKNPEINITVRQEGEQSRTLTFNNAGFVIDMFDCLKVARLLNIDLSKYKRKIISLLPYTLTNEFDLVLTILNDIGIHSVNGEDLDWLLDIYQNETYGDLCLLDSCKIFDLIERGYIVSKELNKNQIKILNALYEKTLNYDFLTVRQIEAIIFSMKKFNNINKDYLEDVYLQLVQRFQNVNYFEDYIGNKFTIQDIKEYKKLLALNEILICNFKEESAINRRFDQFEDLKTDYKMASIEGEFFTGVSRAEDEFYLKDRFYRKLYEPLLENIKYPEYLDRFLKLFEILKRFDINGIVKPYLYNILEEYLKNADGDEILTICLNCGDNVFVGKYMRDYLTKGQINKFNDIKKDVIIANLYEKIKFLQNEQSQLQKDLNKKGKITLYVEGKTDKKYLEKAMEELGINLKINIIACGGCINVFNSLSGVIDEGIGGIHIGLLDLDSGGIANWTGKDLSNRLFSNQKCLRRGQKGFFGNKILENLLKFGKKRCRYSFIFIPRVDNFKNQIFKDGIPYQGIINSDNPNEFLSKVGIVDSPILKTEHLIYNDNIKVLKDYYKIIELPGGGKIIDCSDNKTKKTELCKKIIGGEIELPNENWLNFKRIFDYIDEIQKEINMR